MEWLKNLSSAIDYIEDNLDSDISYEEAAKIACCATTYFQRMFAYVSGITLVEYIRRRRMTQAAFELQSKDVKGCTLHAFPPIKFSIQINGGDNMPYRIEEKTTMRIVGIRIPLTYDMDENYKRIPLFWEQTKQSDVFGKILDLSNTLQKEILGVSVYNSCDEFYYYIAVATDQPAPEGMYEYELPDATWVVFESDGPFKESIQTIYKRFFTEWLPFSGYKYAEIADVEVYSVHDEKTVGGYAQIWMSIRKERG